MKTHRRAFTLIELLVVIAIIAILAAILFPVFAQAKVAAKKTADLSNMKQTTLGLLIYITDFDDLFPVYSFGQDNPREAFLQSYLWSSKRCVGPYIKNTDILKSPDDNIALDQPAEWPADRADWKPSSYMPNTVNPSVDSYFPGYAGVTGPIAPGPMMDSQFGTTTSGVSQTLASNPSDVILLAEGRPDWEKCAVWANTWTNQEIQWYPYWTVGIGSWGWDIQAVTVAPWNADCERTFRKYNGAANFTFVDGHAKTMRPGELMTDTNPKPSRWLMNAQ